MPKISKVGKFRQTAAATTTDQVVVVDDGNDNALSRGQRKRQGKKDQYLKRQKLVLSTLRVQGQEDQKKRIDGLDALKEALQATVTETIESENTKDSPAPVVVSQLNTNKAKKELTSREVLHLGLVLEHPAFQENPFATIQEHLKNTLAGQAKELEKEGEVKAKEKAVAAEKRKKVRKVRQRENGGKHRKKFRATRSRK